MKVEISDARWEAITKVAQRYGLPAQVVLDHILDEVLGHGLNPTELRLLDLGLLRAPEEARIGPSTANRAPTADEMLAALYAETGAIADDEPAATAVRAAEESLAHLRSRLQDIAEPFHQDPSHYEDADYNYEDADDDGRDGDIATPPPSPTSSTTTSTTNPNSTEVARCDGLPAQPVLARQRRRSWIRIRRTAIHASHATT